MQQENGMTNDDRAAGNEPTDETAAGSPQSRAGSDGLIQFVSTKGTQVAGRHRDKAERIAETVCDLELACEGAFGIVTLLNGRAANWHRTQAQAAAVTVCHRPIAWLRNWRNVFRDIRWRWTLKVL